MKELMEKRAQLMEQIEELSKSIEMEKRAFTDEENTKFDAITKEVESIDATIAQMERAEKLVKVDNKPDEAAGAESKEEMEVRAFAEFIRNERADSNITKGDNTAVIPKTIADKIIDKIKDISPLFRDAEKFNVKGTLSIPYVDGSNDNLTVAYADEFTDLEAKSTKLLSVDLSGYLAGVLAKVSMSLINSTDIELVDFVVAKMAMAAATFIDKEILVGT
ncbi:MAG: phage major capsid protein, partial [Clostridiales bacterium]|nr:phage major capsid protein [Clostridiales bacterium]